MEPTVASRRDQLRAIGGRLNGTAGAPVRRISVVVPMRNEAHRVQGLVDDLVAQDFEGEVEVLIADGGSTDGSPELLSAAAERAGLEITLLENPRRSVAPGLNACIERARGDLIVRLDLKSRYPPDYLRRCARAAEETGVWSLGGLAVPVGESRTERAVACAMDSMFGGIHWTRHRTSSRRVYADTVYLGAWRPEAFDRIGHFADLGPDHDEEFNLRLRRAGGRVVLDPTIRAYYTPRRSLSEVFRQYYAYGLWKPAVMRRGGTVVSARACAPPAFLVSLVLLAATSHRSVHARRMLVLEAGTYACCSAGFAAAAIRRRRERWGLVALTAAAFPTFHLAFGLGMLAGLLRSVRPAARSDSGGIDRLAGPKDTAGEAEVSEMPRIR